MGRAGQMFRYRCWGSTGWGCADWWQLWLLGLGITGFQTLWGVGKEVRPHVAWAGFEVGSALCRCLDQRPLEFLQMRLFCQSLISHFCTQKKNDQFYFDEFQIFVLCICFSALICSTFPYGFLCVFMTFWEIRPSFDFGSSLQRKGKVLSKMHHPGSSLPDSTFSPNNLTQDMNSFLQIVASIYWMIKIQSKWKFMLMMIGGVLILNHRKQLSVVSKQ